MIEVACFTFNPFQENTYVLYDETRSCVIIDPGCFSPHEQNQLIDFIQTNALKPQHLLNTHCHIDHILGNAFVMEQYNLDLKLHKDELFTYTDANKWVSMLGINLIVVPTQLAFIDETHTIQFGNSSLNIAYTPGHSKASLTFYNLNEKLAIAGDVLFRESIGRTDLPGGNFDTLIDSIRTQLLVLPDDTTVYSGHGPATTIGHERRFNPFLT
jgi:hydroxyacylglutathione hydrolase